MSEKIFLEEAYKEALKAYKKGEVPIGAVVVKDGKIIGRGHNKRIEKKNALYHAEIVAIEEACKSVGNWRLDDCVIYVTVEPCVMCAGAIMQSRIRKVVFGAKDEKGGAVVSQYTLFSNKKLPFKIDFSYVECEKCSQILKDFFKERRLKPSSENQEE
ncbi:MAG: nucleoside deaminase [Aquificae bacterium]|nr:nucleoside deaminase [Aquificota bacterium]